MNCSITDAFEPAILGWSVGALVAELGLSLIPGLRSALAVLLLVAGACALAGSICAAVARRVEGLGAAALLCTPGAFACACSFLAAWAVIL